MTRLDPLNSTCFYREQPQVFRYLRFKYRTSYLAKSRSPNDTNKRTTGGTMVDEHAPVSFSATLFARSFVRKRSASKPARLVVRLSNVFGLGPGRKEPRGGREVLNVSITNRKVFDRLSVSGPHSPPTLHGERQQSLVWLFREIISAPTPHRGIRRP